MEEDTTPAPTETQQQPQQATQEPQETKETQETTQLDPRETETVGLFWGMLPGEVSQEEAQTAIGAGFVEFNQAPHKPFGFLTVKSSVAATLLSSPPEIRGSQTRIEERTASRSNKASRTIFIGSVPQNTEEQQIRDHFSPVEPTAVRFSFRPERDYGVSFVEFATPEDAQQAAAKGDITIGDNTLHVKLDEAGSGGGRGRGRGDRGGRGGRGGRGERSNDPSNELFISNCPSDINDDILKEHFAPYVPSRIHWNFKPDRPAGFGFVTFDSVEDATQALSKGEISCGGNTCGVRFAQPKPEGGGGGGGGGRGRGDFGGRGGRGGRGDRGGRGGRGDRGRGRGRGGNQMKQGATGAGVASSGKKTTFDD